MTRAERLRILGPEAVAEIHRIVAAAPAPMPEQLALLRRIFTAGASVERHRTAA